MQNNTELLDNLSEYEKELKQFYIKALISEASKIIIFSIIFTIIRLHKEFWVSLFFLFLFRTNSGGIHCSKYLNCLLLSFFIILFDILLGLKFFTSKFFMFILYFVAGIICFKLTPIQAKTRPPATKELIKKAKSKTLLIILIYGCFLFFRPISAYNNIGFWMLIIHSIQLLIAHYLTRR